jgi:hypothetical protein
LRVFDQSMLPKTSPTNLSTSVWDAVLSKLPQEGAVVCDSPPMRSPRHANDRQSCTAASPNALATALLTSDFRDPMGPRESDKNASFTHSIHFPDSRAILIDIGGSANASNRRAPW